MGDRPTIGPPIWIPAKSRGLNPQKGYPIREVFQTLPVQEIVDSWADRPKRRSWSSFAARIYSGSRSNVSRGCRDRLRLSRGDSRTPSPLPPRSLAPRLLRPRDRTSISNEWSASV
jgi:hypothetical protein